jgi:hexosaminidase
MRLVLPVLLFPTLIHALWPNPRSLSTGTTPLRLAPHFTISIPSSYPEDLHAAVTRTTLQLRSDNLERLIPGRGSTDASKVSRAAELDVLELRLTDGAPPTTGIAAETVQALGARDEAYTLVIPTQGPAKLTAESALGLWRGLTTFSQLWYSHGGDVYTLSAPIEISDAPAYVSLLPFLS